MEEGGGAAIQGGKTTFSPRAGHRDEEGYR